MIRIEKLVELPNGATVAHHVVDRAGVAPDGDALAVFGESWASAAARAAGHAPIDRFHVRVPLAALAPSLVPDLAAWLAANDLLAGGAVLPAPATDLETLRAMKWAEMKAARHAAEFSTVVSNGREFDADPQAQLRIQGAAQLALLALAANEPFTIDWTLADNSVASLTIPDVVELGRALAWKIQLVYARSREVRQAIAQAETPEQIAAIAW